MDGVKFWLPENLWKFQYVSPQIAMYLAINAGVSQETCEDLVSTTPMQGTPPYNGGRGSDKINFFDYNYAHQRYVYCN